MKSKEQYWPSTYQDMLEAAHDSCALYVIFTKGKKAGEYGKKEEQESSIL